MATTTNFGWDTPDDTDLVKDGAAAIRTLGNSIDTSFVDLKGGTTNQVLAKNSNTDLDFKWVADATGIPATIIDAKGDLIAGTAADTAGRLAVGANGTVLTADSGETTGLKWATPAGQKSFSLLNTGGTALTGAATITYTTSGGYDQYYVVIDGASGSNAANSSIGLRLNGITSNDYYYAGAYNTSAATYASSNISGISVQGTNNFRIGRTSDNAGSVCHAGAFINGANKTGLTMIMASGSGNAATGNGQVLLSVTGYANIGAAITSISAFIDTGTFDAGTMYIYGAV